MEQYNDRRESEMAGYEALEQILSDAKSDIDGAVELLDSAHQRLHALSVFVEEATVGVVMPDDPDHELQTVSSD